MSSVPNKSSINIPSTNFGNGQNHQQIAFDQFEEEFCFGSPQKRQPGSFSNEDRLTQEGTPEKDMLMNCSNSKSSMSDENHSTFSDHISQTGPSDFHRDVFADDTSS